MTNGEKYKTAQERADAFNHFCLNNTMGCDGCVLSDVHGENFSQCRFAWLDLEAKEEKLLPCYECGKETIITCKNGTEIGFAWHIECGNCGHCSGWYKKKDEAISAHNRVAKAVMESEAK